jgi:hypothetical protein
VTSSYTRFRRLLRIHVLPWVVGALVLRAMIPMGFMPAEGTTLGAVLCSTQGLQTEQIEIPGPPSSMQCDFCLLPAFAAPPAATAGGMGAAQDSLLSQAHEALPHRFSLDRAQSARAPPV